MDEGPQVREVQRWWHGELAVLVPSGILLLIIGGFMLSRKDEGGFWLLIIAMASLAIGSRMSAIILEDGNGLVVIYRRWGHWKVLRAAWKDIEISKARIGLNLKGQIALPKGARLVIGRGYFGTAYIRVADAAPVIVRLRNPKRLLEFQKRKVRTIAV